MGVMALEVKINTKASSSKKKKLLVNFRVADCVETIGSINIFTGHQRNTQEQRTFKLQNYLPGGM